MMYWWQPPIIIVVFFAVFIPTFIGTWKLLDKLEEIHNNRKKKKK